LLPIMTANINTKSEPFLSKIEPVHRQLQAWRRARKHRERIPDSLWKAMTELAGVFGVSRVSQAMGVEYHGLKERVHGSKQPGRPSDNQPAFVELPVPVPTHQSECLVELEDRLGAKMTLRLGPGSGAEVLALVQAFWRRQS